MSDLKTCITNGIAEGKITPEQGADATSQYDAFFDALDGVLPEGERAAQAARQTFSAIEKTAIERRRQLRLQETVSRQILAEFDQYQGKDKAAAAMAYFYDDGFAQYPNIRDRKLAVQGLAGAEMGEMQLDFMRGITGGQRNKKLLDDTIDEIFGGKTGNGKASDYAARWYNAAEIMRKMFNDAGGHIGKLDNWGLPTRHNINLFRATTFEKWRGFIDPLLDRSKMIDRMTGEPFSNGRLELALKDMYEAVRTRDFSRKDPSRLPPGKSKANQRAEERFLIFKDGPSWRAYQTEFGTGKPYEAMIEHIDGMSTDIAAMQTFGPNPDGTIRWLSQVVEADMQRSQSDLSPKDIRKAEARVKKAQELTQTMWKHYTGAVNNPVNVTVADLMGGVRNYLTGTYLGGTTLLAAPTDFMNQTVARKFAGLSVTRQLAQVLRQLNPKSRAGRIVAIRAGLVNQHVMTKGYAAAKYNGGSGLKGLTGQYADTALRLTGLSQLTQASRSAMGIEFMGTLADNRNVSFDGLDPALQRILQKSGLEADWEDLRRAPVDTRDGHALINSDAISGIPGLTAAQKIDLKIRYSAGIHAQIEYGTVTGSLRSSQWLQSDTRPGTIAGEITKSFKMFKSFPVSIAYMHIARFQATQAAKGTGAATGYAAAVMTSYTLGGALAVQLADLKNGKDPQDMSTKEFWGQAMLKGGGLGIWGDLISQTDSDYGTGIVGMVGGPVAASVQDIGELTTGNILQAAKGDDLRLGRDITKFAKEYMPFGRTFYWQLARDRILMDTMQEYLDPKAKQEFRRKIKSSRRNSNQDFWWAPGDAQPKRAPDWGATRPQ